MGLIQLSRPWTEQPQEAVGVADRYADKFRMLALPGGLVDCARQQPLAFVAGGITPIVGAAGTGLSFAGGAGTLKANIPADTTACTYVVTASNLSNAVLSRLISTYNGSGGKDVYIDGTLGFQEFFSGSNSLHTIPLPGTGNAPVTIAVAMYGVAGVAPLVYINGVKQAVTVASSGAGARIAGGTTVGIGCRPDVTTRQLNGRIYLAAMAGVACAESELFDLSTNPWRLFAPRTQRIWAPTAASGLPTLSAATYVPGSLTATGFRPRVTATY